MTTSVKNLFLLSVSLLAAIAFSELIVRLFVPVRSVGPSFTVYDPTYGKRLKKNFSATRITPEFTFQFSTNSYGFRGPEPLSFPSRPILFLGDSFTMGYGVDDGKEFPALIKKALHERFGINAIPVANAGMGNNGNGRWLKFLRSEGKSYNPRLIVLQIMNNDFGDNLKESLFELSSDFSLIELPVPKISMVRMIQNVVDKIPGLSSSHLIGLLNQGWWLLTHKQPAKSLQQNSTQQSSHNKDLLTYRLLEKIIAISDDEGWPILAIIVGIKGKRLTELKRRFKGKNVPILIAPGRKERPDLYYKVDGHWNIHGHAFAAELILSKFQELDISKL